MGNYSIINHAITRIWLQCREFAETEIENLEKDLESQTKLINIRLMQFNNNLEKL